MNPRAALRSGGILLVALGLVRGFGGTLLLLHGGGLDPAITARPGVAAGVAWGLIGIGALALASGLLALLARRGSVPLGVATVIAFLIDGAANGWLLFGRPGAAGTALNLAAGALIVGLLLAGRKAVREVAHGGFERLG